MATPLSKILHVRGLIVLVGFPAVAGATVLFLSRRGSATLNPPQKAIGTRKYPYHR